MSKRCVERVVAMSLFALIASACSSTQVSAPVPVQNPAIHSALTQHDQNRETPGRTSLNREKPAADAPTNLTAPRVSGTAPGPQNARNSRLSSTAPPSGGAPRADSGGLINAEVFATTELGCGAREPQFRSVFIQLINATRAQPRHCGNTFHEAAPALIWNLRLAEAARRHSLDMVQNDFFGHAGSDNSGAAERVDAVDYDWQTVGENLAAGQRSLQEAMDGWLASPGHCRNLMNPSFREAGLSCVENQSTEFSTYWTNVFGAEFE